MAAILGVQILGKMPNSANHVFLEFLCLALIGLVDASRGHERELAIKAGRWIVIIVLFYSGLQKLVHGYYFDGPFLAFATATDDRFAFLFRHFLPAAEFDRLLAMGDESLGMGPYRVDSAIFVAISNITYVSEIVIPILMVIRKTRAFATILAVLFVVVVEAGAREFLFGTLIINLLLLYLRGRWIQWLFPLFATIYVYLVAADFEWVPMFCYTH